MNGFAIYAIGYGYANTSDYSNDIHTYGNNTLLGISTSSAITTGTNTSGNTSNWAMKLEKVTDTSNSYVPANLTIENSFDAYHTVPTEYTKVATYSSTTDQTLGAKLTTTYATFISGTQVADTYEGAVKYTMVHPSDAAAPLAPLKPSDCPEYSICYAPNASDIVGSMDSISETKISTSETAGVQTGITSGTAELIAPNYSRSGYGFAGWSTDFTATNSSTIYGPNETITTGDLSTYGMILYPVWIASAGTMQNASSVCSNLAAATYDSTNNKMNATLANVSALTDSRDGNTYAIAKLIDGNCWMIENLRLDESATGINTAALSESGSSFTISALPTTTNTFTTSSYTAIEYNKNNINTSLTASYNGTGNSTYYSWYSYGNYYSWAAARGTTSALSSGNTTTSICPAGWHLPYGSNGTTTGGGNTSGGFYYLNTLMANNTSTQGSKDWRSFPNNFVISGYFGSSSASLRGSRGLYWSSTADGSSYSYSLALSSSYVGPSLDSSRKYNGFSIRCVR